MNKAPSKLPKFSPVPGMPLAGWDQNLRGDLLCPGVNLKTAILGCCPGCPGLREAAQERLTALCSRTALSSLSFLLLEAMGDSGKSTEYRLEVKLSTVTS